MTTTLCINCGVPLGTPFCSQCGARAPQPPHDIDATLVRSAPLVPRSVEFPPPMVIPESTLPPAIAPEPTVVLPPLFPPPSAVAHAKRDRTRMWVVAGAAVALLVGATSVALAVGEGSPNRPSAGIGTGGAAPSPTASSATPVVAAALEPGTRSSLVPSWANKNVGRLVRAEKVLGATGPAVFASPGHNICAVVGSEVSCVATPLWHAHDPGALPPLDPACSSAADGRWSVFTIGSAEPPAVAGCSTTPTALTLGPGTAPYNKVIGMGASGILCYIDARRGASTSQTGVACWSPASNHGFMITHQDMRLW